MIKINVITVLKNSNPIYTLKILLTFLLISTTFFCKAQKAYSNADNVKDFEIKKILNYTSPAASLNQIKKELTVIDFFGTWCVPCIKALPHLTELQNRFRDKVSILLVSVETEAKLIAFIEKRKPFPFAVAVDTDNGISGLFQPPSYPYTVVLDKNNTIVAITDVASLSDTLIEGLLSGKKEMVTTAKISTAKNVAPMPNNQLSKNSTVALSQQFIYAAKTGDSITGLLQQLNNLSYNNLKNDLVTDNAKKTFWINIYNGYTQMLLKKDAEQYKSRSKFYKSRQIAIAGKLFSLDDVEHGILRHSKIKWSLGYLNKLFPGKTEKELRVDTLDYRIHFALNCGAASCPPIAFYIDETINTQLDIATNNYLHSEAAYDSTKNRLELPALMSWFRRDFGGKKKMKQLLKQLDILPSQSDPSIHFKKYNWDLYLSNYKN